MKTTFIKNRRETLKAFVCSVALLALMAFVLPQAVQANMASNTPIINSARAAYNDGTPGGPKYTDWSSVTVTVTLVPAAAGVDIFGGDQTTMYTGSNTTLNNTFDVTAASNGPDTYTLTGNPGTQTNNSNSGTLGTISPASPITVGATITVGTSTVNALTVPTDGAMDAKINEIQAGDTIVVNIGGTDYVRTVGVVADTGSGMQSIPVTVAFPSAPASATLVRERVRVTVPVISGTIVAAGTNITIQKTLTVTSQSTGNPTTTSGTVTDTYTNGLIEFKKYVRNTLTLCTGGTPVMFNTNTYCDTGVTGKPGETLEYLMVIWNRGTAPVSAAVVTDTVPVDYVNWVGGSVVYYDESNGAHGSLTDAINDDPVNWSSPSLTVNVGDTTLVPLVVMPPSLPAAGGWIAAGATVHVVYQVTVR